MRIWQRANGEGRRAEGKGQRALVSGERSDPDSPDSPYSPDRDSYYDQDCNLQSKICSR